MESANNRSAYEDAVYQRDRAQTDAAFLRGENKKIGTELLSAKNQAVFYGVIAVVSWIITFVVLYLALKR